MAFEAYLGQMVARPRRGGRIIFPLSIAAHGIAVLCAVAYSFWHVEEVTPPHVIVTFVSAASLPAPPPPPPPLGGGAAAKKKMVVRPKVEVAPRIPDRTPEIVQPKVETPREAPKEPPREAAKPEPATSESGPGSGDGVKGGVAGGVSGGVAGGALGGAGKLPGPSVAAKFLPPLIGKQQKLSGADPDFPAFLRRPGAHYLVMAKICIATSGAVESVTLQKRAQPVLDANVLATVKTWRYRPWMANGNPVPFCTFANFDFGSE